MITSTGEEDTNEVYILEIPGGPATFELCAKFCYEMTFTLNAYNVVAARCAAEYLEMNETVEKGNLVYKIEVFLSSGIFRSWKDSILVLKTTESLLPLAEELKVVSHCIDAIASKACVDISKVDWSYTYNRRKLPEENGLDPNTNTVRNRSVPKDWWVEDLCDLDIDTFRRIITNIKTKAILSAEVIGESLKAYTYRRLQGFKKGVIHSGNLVKYRLIVNTIVSLLPSEKHCVSCGFLLKLLKAAILLDSGEVTKRELVRKIGQQLEEASVSDLLIQAREGENTMYDVDTVKVIVEEYLMQDQKLDAESTEEIQELQEMKKSGILSDASKLMVAKLVDGYLAEIAKDPNLPLSKFAELAEMVSGINRPAHDGLYRAIDMYLKV